MKYYSVLLIASLAFTGCKAPGVHNLPPATKLMHPGPGVGGPGPGVLEATPPVRPFPTSTSQVAFIEPQGMMVFWDVAAPGQFDSEPLVAPARYNFGQGAIYRLKITNLPARPGVELYPTIEIAPAMPRTDPYLAHNAIPVQFTPADLDQVMAGNFVTKVVYLPDPEFQDLAIADVEVLVSTKLEPGVDPIVEADRRGSILAIIRLGNKDLQVPGGEGVVDGFGPGGEGFGGPMPYCLTGAAGNTGSLPGHVAGATAPTYGMPITGTPIGLPGPPHIPLGVPAGLKRHTITNHTKYHIPRPTQNMDLHVKQSPGFSYPRPVNTVHIHERVGTPPINFHQPADSKYQVVPGDPYCP